MIIFLLVVLMMSSIIPFVFAKQRKIFLTDYILSTKIEQSGFSNTQRSESFSYEATMNALEILKFYHLFNDTNFFGEVTKNVDKQEFQDNLKGKIDGLFKQSRTIIYDLYHLFKALEILGHSFSSSEITRTKDYLDQCNQPEGGFAPINTSSSASMISTYFAIQLYSIIDEFDNINKNQHKNWVLNCNNTDGGYGGNSSSPSSLLNTYYTVLIINELGDLNELESRVNTVNYLDSFYISQENDINNYGGYLPDSYSYNALLSSTFYCVKAISILDSEQLNSETTINWVLNRQNFEDGGFAENSPGNEQKFSSVSSSYNAFQTLKIFQADLQMLDEDIWNVEFNFWILLILLLGTGIGIALLIVLWRKRRI